MKAFVYILQDLNKKYYIGSTTDLKRRMYQHNSGHTKTTSNMNFPKLIFSQQYDSLDKARKIERKLKKLKRKDYIDNIIKDKIIKMNP